MKRVMLRQVSNESFDRNQVRGAYNKSVALQQVSVFYTYLSIDITERRFEALKKRLFFFSALLSLQVLEGPWTLS